MWIWLNELCLKHVFYANMEITSVIALTTLTAYYWSFRLEWNGRNVEGGL